jgi:hypothetical protein
VTVLRIVLGLVSFFICPFEFMVLSFVFGTGIRARSFYPKERISNFEGLQKSKAGIGRYLRWILGFKFEEPIRKGPFFSKLRRGQREKGIRSRSEARYITPLLFVCFVSFC